MAVVQNPVIRGFNPDPSVCRVGRDFFLVTSSFEFFPGIPIYHSTDLANWELIGHCLTEAKHLDLRACRPSGGLYAPTIRYHDGYFFVTCTNVTGKGNFIIHASDIRGPWSEPAWIDQGGIDPSPFFDGGKCYLSSSYEADGASCILQCEIDPMTGKRLTPSRPITYGTGGRYPEAPHLYRIDDQYYLMLAEGGTEYGHMVTMFRSDNPWGPFEACPCNPILTHRDAKAQTHSFQCVGHADLIQDSGGRWWIFALAVRRLPGLMLHHLGRETFLGCVTWDAERWPTVNRNGTLTEYIDVPGAGERQSENFFDDFSGDRFSEEYSFIRNPCVGRYVRSRGTLHLFAGDSMDSDAAPTFIGVRQKEWVCRTSVRVCLEAEVFAGLSAFYCGEHHYDFGIDTRDGERRVLLRKRLYENEIECEVEIGDGEVTLTIEADVRDYRFSFEQNGVRMDVGHGSVAGLCTECTRAFTFTGVMLGMFCQQGAARFRDFSVRYDF